MSVQMIDRIAGDPLAVPYAKNSAPVQRVDKGYQCLAFMDLRFALTITHAGYTTPPQAFVESLENIVAGVKLNATGKGGAATIGTIKDVDLAYLFQMTRFLEKTPPVRVAPGTNNAAYVCETNARIYFALPSVGRSIMNFTARELFSMHILDARFLSNFTITPQFRDETAAFSGTGANGGTTTISNAQLTIQVRELTGLPTHAMTKKGRKPILRPFVKESQALYDVTSTKQDQRYKDLPTGNLIRRMVFKGTVGSNPWSDPSDAPFANTSRTEGGHLRLQENNSYNFMDIVYQQQRAQNKNEFSLESMPAGYCVWNSPTGRNMVGIEKLDMLVDTNFTNGSTNEIQATITELVG